MATLKAFKALRPKPTYVKEVASVPYDVITVEEARNLAKNNPLSFLHVVRPEIDLPIGIDEHDDSVYQEGKENLASFAQSDFFEKEEKESLYVYRLVQGNRVKTGVFGLVSVDEYNAGILVKHENTRPDKEEDRTKHILSQQAFAEPVMLTYRNQASIDVLVDEAKKKPALFDFEAVDEVRHTIWKIEETQPWLRAFEEIEKLYIADGHHRCKAASLVNKSLDEDGVLNGKAKYFPAVLFPVSEMNILPYNRIIHSVPQGRAYLLKHLRELFVVEVGANPVPEVKGKISLYMDGTWYGITLPESHKETIEASLDVARLSEFFLEPLLSIFDQKTDKNISFVGGLDSVQKIEKLVDTDVAKIGISMYPTSIEELLAVSDASLLMPPKSTWFEPKLRSGLLIHQFN